MSDYEPLDLSAFCNAGPELYPSQNPPPGGSLTFHGLPFQVGAGRETTDDGRPAATLIGFGEGEGLRSQPLAIPVKAAAQRVIFAHARLESKIPEGDPAGRVVA